MSRSDNQRLYAAIRRSLWYWFGRIEMGLGSAEATQLSVGGNAETRRQWVAVRNTSRYWFARLILEQTGVEAAAFVSGLHPHERRAIMRFSKARRYHRLRASGLSPLEAQARLNSRSTEAQALYYKKKKQAYRQKWGGYPTPGTEAFNRWVIER
jgi:hypothetical protein